MLEAKKVLITLEAKLCNLKEEQAQDYFEVNASMGSVTSFKNIFAIEHCWVCLDFPKYGGKNMKYYKVYKHAIEYMPGECPFIYCINKKKCTYPGQFLAEILAENWKTMETCIKESPTLEFDYAIFMKMRLFLP